MSVGGGGGAGSVSSCSHLKRMPLLIEFCLCRKITGNPLGFFMMWPRSAVVNRTNVRSTVGGGRELTSGSPRDLAPSGRLDHHVGRDYRGGNTARTAGGADRGRLVERPPAWQSWPSTLTRCKPSSGDRFQRNTIIQVQTHPTLLGQSDSDLRG